MKRSLLTFALLFFTLLAVVLVRGISYFEDRQFQPQQGLPEVNFDQEAAIKRFVGALKIPTISYDKATDSTTGKTTPVDMAPFARLVNYLQQAFPLVYARSEYRTINNYSLIFHLPGSNPNLLPALFLGHTDVVPIANADAWQHPPFSGARVNGDIWGRGSMDDKVTVLALLEAMQLYLQQGRQPQRSLYFAFGHDEEIGGTEGAKAIAQHFAKQGLRFEYVLDEGGYLTQGLIPGVSDKVALIGIAEKGFVNLHLSVAGKGGHSSQPPAQTPAGILAKALVNIEGNPFPATLDYFNLIFDAVGFAMPLNKRLPLANQWLLKPLIMQNILASTSSAASSRTTTAITMLQGSPKSNVLPSKASAVVNFRILPGETPQSVKSRIEGIIDDPRVSVSASEAFAPSPVSPTNSLGFKLIEQNIRRFDPNTLVAPYLVPGATDARYYTALSDNVYRFMMVRITPQSLGSFHGINEKISEQDYLNAIRFYLALIQQSAEDSPTGG